VTAISHMTTAMTERAAAAAARFVVVLGAALLTAVSTALAQTSEAAESSSSDIAVADAVARGRAKYAQTCAPCHARAPGGDMRYAMPGTRALAIKYRGALPAALEDRSDLSYEVLRVFVRNGSWSMPPFRPTELGDEEIRDIAAYLAVSSRGQANANR